MDDYPFDETKLPSFEIFFWHTDFIQTSPATDEQLKQVYPGSEKPYLMQNNGYYRYLVGKFPTLSEAKAFKNNNQVVGFIVSYKDGERILVQEAVELLKQKD